MRLILAAVAALISTGALAQGYTLHRGYVTGQGTYVAPHYQTNPNTTRLDNWSTRGNTNPFTGQPGYRDPSPYSTPRSYSSPYSGR